MFYALKQLTIGRGVTVAAGQPIPSASSWSYPVLRAHLNLGWIEERAEEPAAEKPAEAAPIEAAAKPAEPEKKAPKKKASGSRK